MSTTAISGRTPLFLAMSLSLVTSGYAATITVTDGGDSGTALTCTLRQALASANADSAGSSSCADGNGSDTIVFDPSLASSTITLAQGKLAASTPLTITGSGQTIDAGGLTRVFDIYAAVAMSGLILTNGYYAGAGGGVFVGPPAGDLSLGNVTISKNAAGQSGGGIWVLQSNLSLNNSSVSNNHSGTYGGGVLIKNGTLTITDSSVSGNTAFCATGTGNSCGAGIYSSGSTVDISGSTISGNAASGSYSYMAGGIMSINDTLTLTGSTVSGNTADTTASYLSGGIYAKRDILNVIASTIAANSATSSGRYATGGIYVFDSVALIANSTVTNNQASGYYSPSGGLSENHPTGTSPSSLTLINATISGNSAIAPFHRASNLVGGAQVGIVETGYLSAVNTILSGNTSAIQTNTPAPSDISVDAGHGAQFAASTSLLGSSLSANYSGNGNVFTDSPELGPLQDNGGPTQTMALTAVSLAIGAGSNVVCAASHVNNVDQRGVRRPQGANCDIGAVELVTDRIFADNFDGTPTP